MIPVHERRILEAHVRGINLSTLALIQHEKPLNEYEERELKNMIKMRMKGFPLQYLTGNQAFYGREFYVNTSVLIPRPETEGLVELVLKNLPPFDPEAKLQGLDVGTGSGCIALTLALERRDLTMTASECSDGAHSVAVENAGKLRVLNVDFLHVSETPHAWQYDDVPPLDVLVSNPPYLVFSDEIANDVREHEPAEALFTPDGDPMYFYRFLAELAETKLKPSGFGAFEIAEQRGEETAEIFRQRGWKAEIFKDLAERDRYLIVRRPGKDSDG